MNEVKSIRIEVRRGTVSHQLFFLYRPTSFALARQTLAADHLAEMDALVRGLSVKTRDQNCILGNVCIIDVFLYLLANGHATAEATLTFFPSPDAAVRAAQPEDFNRVVLCTDLVSEDGAKLLGVDVDQLKERTIFRGG
jgi:hypothetical protein